MKNLCLIACILIVFGNISAQSSFSNIAFDGPEKYKPKTKSKKAAAAEFRLLKDKIRAFPSRLDYRYHYLNELSLAEEWSRVTNEVISLVNYSYNTNHNWMWDKKSDPIGDDSEGFLLTTIQDFVFMLYLTNDEARYRDIRAISNAVLLHNAQHRDFMTYPAMTYTAQGDYDSALECLHKAEGVHREDATVAILLAENYQQQGNENMALSYYKKVVRYGNERELQEAKTQIEKLEDKQ